MKKLKKYIPLVMLFPLNALADEEIEVDILVGSQHEECFYVGNESSLTYQYQTNSPLDFNFHYHDDNGMNFLVELNKSTENTKTVKPLQNKQVYCLMWVNSLDSPAKLTYLFTME